MAQSNGDEEHIMLLALAMHSSQYEKPSDRVDVIKKWLNKYNEADRKQHELDAAIGELEAFCGWSNDERDGLVLPMEVRDMTVEKQVMAAKITVKDRIAELKAERSKYGTK